MSTVVESSGPGRGLQDFVDQEEVGEQRTQMDRRVEVVDDLRSDRGERQDELNRRARVAGVAVDHRHEAAIRRGIETGFHDEREDELTDAGERGVAALQVIADLMAAVADGFGRKALGGVRQEKLVRLLDGIYARVEFSIRGPRPVDRLIRGSPGVVSAGARQYYTR